MVPKSAHMHHANADADTRYRRHLIESELDNPDPDKFEQRYEAFIRCAEYMNAV